MSKPQSFFIVLLVLIGFVGSQSAFIVREFEQTMVLQFGDPVKKYTSPGLKFKMPFIQQVRVFDKRVLDIDPPAEEVILADQKRLVVDTFARYKINDMLTFFSTLSTEQQANVRLDNIINSTTRSILGSATLADILSEKRTDLMTAIRQQVNATVGYMGVEIVDVRIGRADLPDQTSQSIYARMKTEREREAAEFRAQGQEQAQKIKSEADKTRTVLLAEAQREAEVVKGQGDEQAIRIYAEAFKKDPEFYAFYRTMQAYREGLAGENTTLILPQDGDFLKFLKGTGTAN